MAVWGQLLGLGCYFYPTYDEGGECRVHRDPWTVVLLSNVFNILAPGAIGSEHYGSSLVRIEYMRINWGLLLLDTCTFPNNGGKHSHQTKWAPVHGLIQCGAGDHLQKDEDGSCLPQPGSSSVGTRGPSTHNAFIYNIIILLK